MLARARIFIYMPKIKVNNVNLFYEETGQGEPVVLISGFSAVHQIWEGMVPAFAKKYRVITFDNRGAGLSDCPNYPYTIDQMTADVVNLCQLLNIQKAHFIGNSMGGCIVQNLAYKFPHLMKSIVISNSFPVINSRSKLWVESRAALFKIDIPLEALFKNFLPQLYSNSFLARPKMIETLIQIMQSSPAPITETGYLNQMQALFNFDSSTWLHHISCPCLIINADDDSLADVAGGQKMAQTIPNAVFYCFQNVGHLPHYEQPELFIKLVFDFMAKVRQRCQVWTKDIKCFSNKIIF